MSNELVVKVPDESNQKDVAELPPIQIVTEEGTKRQSSPPLPKKPNSPAPVKKEQILHKVHSKKQSPVQSKKKKILAPKQAHVQKPVHQNSVQKFLKENPDFAYEFSQTIPISPKILESDTEDAPSVSHIHKKNERNNMFLGKKDKRVQNRDNKKGHDNDEYAEEIEEDDANADKTDDSPSTDSLDNENISDNDLNENEETKEETDSINEDEEMNEEEEEKSKKSGKAQLSEDQDASGHEVDVFGTKGSSKLHDVKSKKKKKVDADQDVNAVVDEDTEAMEKMHLIEDIKENSAMGLVPPQPPAYNMPLKLLRQIQKFQEEKAAEIMAMGMMGTGLVSIVGMLETLNGRFDPVGKLLGHGLKLNGAREKVEEQLSAYKVPFTRMYRNLKKKGHSMEPPPWVQIILITGGILKEVHLSNLYREMQESAQQEQTNPDAVKRAQEVLQQHKSSQQSKPDNMPYCTQTQEMQPKSDAEMEATLMHEFAGFDKLPSLTSIAAKRKEVMSSTNALKPLANNSQLTPTASLSRVDTVAPLPIDTVDTSSICTNVTAQKSNTVELQKVPSSVAYVHPSEGSKIELMHSAANESDKETESQGSDVNTGSVSDNENGDGDGDDSSLAPIIQVPSIEPSK